MEAISYECHITIKDNVEHSTIEKILNNVNWKFSCIKGDPILGKQTFCYATKHYPTNKSKEEVIEKVNEASNLFEKNGLEIIRKKIELIIWDTKYEK